MHLHDPNPHITAHMCAYMLRYNIQKYMLHIYIYKPIPSKHQKRTSSSKSFRLHQASPGSPGAGSERFSGRRLMMSSWLSFSMARCSWWRACGEENDALKLQDGTGSWCILIFFIVVLAMILELLFFLYTLCINQGTLQLEWCFFELKMVVNNLLG